MSAKTAAKWVRRFRQEGESGLRERSCRPRSSPRRTSAEWAAQTLALHRLRCRMQRIAAALRLSPATVCRILKRHRLNRLERLDPPRPRYKQKRPGDLIHFNILRLARIEKPGHGVPSDRTREARGAGYASLHIASIPRSEWEQPVQAPHLAQ